MNRNYFCRTCTNNISETTFNSIFEEEIHRMLTECTELIIEENDLPSEICLNCITKLKQAYSFRKQVEESDQYFRNKNTSKTDLDNNFSEFRDEGILEEPENFVEIMVEKRIIGHSMPESKSDQKDTLKAPKNLPKVKPKDDIAKNRIFTCPECNQHFTKELDIRYHRKEQHPNSKRIFFCEHCPIQFLCRESLRKHAYVHLDITLFKCLTCEKDFKNPYDLRAHEKRKHSDIERFKCNLCNKILITKEGFESHVAKHKEEESFTCEVCGQSFTIKYQLTEHKRIHNPETTFTCKFCSKIFPRERLCKLHEMSHTNEREIICSVCGKGVVNITKLNIHMRTHTGEKPFKCKFPPCKKQFSTLGSLAVHHFSHTGERRHVCETCGKAYYTSQQLKTHMRTHTGDKPYKCNLCNFKTAHSGALYTHKKSHKLL